MRACRARGHGSGVRTSLSCVSVHRACSLLRSVHGSFRCSPLILRCATKRQRSQHCLDTPMSQHLSGPVASSGGTMTPASRALRNEVRDSLSPSARFGATPVQHPSRGSRPGMPTPRHLQSSVGEVIFGGNAWVTESSPTPVADQQQRTPSSYTPAPAASSPTRYSADAIMPSPSQSHEVRGSPGGVGGAKLHEVGYGQPPPSMQLGMLEHAERRQMTFGAPPPRRPTVGARAELSRSYLHMNSTADVVMWAK